MKKYTLSLTIETKQIPDKDFFEQVKKIVDAMEVQLIIGIEAEDIQIGGYSKSVYGSIDAKEIGEF